MPTYETNLAGLFARPAQAKDLVALLEVGDEVFLEREPDNNWDENAIRVLLNTPGSGFVWIGYVEKLVNAPIARALDEGRVYQATIAKTYPHDGTPAKQGMWAKPMIRIEIDG